MKAEEAAKLSYGANIIDNDSQYQEILRSIKISTMRGEYHIILKNFNIKLDVEEKLIEDGYVLGSIKNECNTANNFRKISWEHLRETVKSSKTTT